MSGIGRVGRDVALAIIVLAASAVAQTTGNEPVWTWEVPFTSGGNTITLSIENGSTVDAGNVSVHFRNLPSWLKFKSERYLMKGISAKGSGDAEFTFSVDRKAPSERTRR